MKTGIFRRGGLLVQWYEYIIYGLQGLLLLVVIVGLVHRLFRDYLGKPSEEEGIVLSKQVERYQQYSKYGVWGHGDRTDYIVEFQTDKKQRVFQVNQMLYDTAVEGQKGKLIYKGDRLIRFEPIE